MTETKTKEVLSFAVELGDIMLRNGGEVYRIEDSILAILNAYNIEDYDVYVLSNGIFASADETTAHSGSMIRHVPMLDMNLGRISALNSLCRDVCNKTISIEDAWERLNQCKKEVYYNTIQLVIATGIGCGGFAYLYGGSILDAIIAILVGFILKIALNSFKKETSKAVKNVLGSAIVSIVAILIYIAGAPVHYDKIIIGGIMPLVPGIPLTNSIRDFINSDYLSGSIRLIDALLTAFCIAVGVGVVITFAHIIGGGVLL
ncbi:MAG: threonine/serine exporter family protein [Pseudobutyrivibrio sp.]|nr:threonine/serine exporter family protein [Pseudobutyrivibrio sp.]